MTGDRSTDARALHAEHAHRWQDADAAATYRLRPTYPDQTFDILLSLLSPGPRAVLDLGCGTGNITRPLAPRVDRIDAVDLAAEMIDVAKALPGGMAGNIHWQVARAEDAALDPPYALAVGGESLHWMDHATLLPRLAGVLAPDAVLAVAHIQAEPQAWDTALAEVVARYSTNPQYVPFDMIAAWVDAGLFLRLGEATTAAVVLEQPLEAFIAAHHANSTLTRAHIDAAAFDAEARAVMREHCADGQVRRSVVGKVAWGRPVADGRDQPRVPLRG